MLLVGNYLPSLAAARALTAAGYRVVAGDGGEYSTVKHSRHCREVWRHPPIADSEAFLGALAAFLAGRPEITTLLPLQERYVAALAPARDQLPGGVTLAAPDGRVVETCLDKSRMHRLALEVGVPGRPLALARDARALEAAAAEVGFPCVIRPADQRTRLAGDRKALICPDRAALPRLQAALPEGHGPLLVQRYVAGPRHNVYFIARRGQALMRLEARVIRTDRIDGTGVAVEEVIVPLDPRLVGYCDALLERLDYTGVGSVQFIVPDEGEPSFLEVNPRHDAAVAGLQACGLPVTVAAIDLASPAGGWRPDPAFRYPAGRRFVWTSRDLYGIGMAISRREIGTRTALRWLSRAIRSAVRADVHLTWSWRDPLPSLAVYGHLATLGPWRRARRRAQAASGARGPSPAAPGQEAVMTPESVLVLGGRHTALIAVRALAAAGYRPVAGDGGEYSAVRHSRDCREVWRHPPVRDGLAFLAALASFLSRRPEITTVLPVDERYMALLAGARDRLPDGVIVASPDARLMAALEKSRLYEVARDAGVPFAAVRRTQDVAGLVAAADEVGYPCVIKPATRQAILPGQRKALRCPDPAALEVLLASWSPGRGALLVQRYVPGPRHNVHFIARSGRILARIEARILRTDRIDGTGLGVEAITVSPDPRLVGYCDALVAALDYTGVGSAQFLVPDEGEPSFLEINPRPGFGYALAEADGLPLTLAAIRLASGVDRWRPGPGLDRPPGRRCAWTSRDVYALGVAISRREVGPRSALRWSAAALGAALRADVHVTWSWRDPLPTLAVYAHLATLGPWRIEGSDGGA